jgi:hypothetical protein
MFRDLLHQDFFLTISAIYLAGLAVSKNGKLATLDRRIPVDAIRGGQEALELIPS